MSSDKPHRSLERMGYRSWGDSPKRTLEGLRQLLKPFGLVVATKQIQDELWFRIEHMTDPVNLLEAGGPPETSEDITNVIPISDGPGHKHWVRIWGSGDSSICYTDSAGNTGVLPMPSGTYKGKIVVTDSTKENEVPIHIIFDGSWPLTASRQGGAQFDSYPSAWDVFETWSQDNASSKTILVMAPTPLSYYFVPAAELD